MESRNFHCELDTKFNVAQKISIIDKKIDHKSWAKQRQVFVPPKPNELDSANRLLPL